MAKAVKPGRKRANQYKMPDPLPKGLIVQDHNKKEWKLGVSIGKGGFGEIYSAQQANSSSSNYPYVIKIEPHANGPLFVEMHFYMKYAKPEDVEAFKVKNKLKAFGMPMYCGSGSHEYNNEKYRFIVMEKFGKDIDIILKEHKGVFSVGTAFKIALQMSYVLEYIHNVGYVHADLKGANILMGATGQAYLVDFGIVTRYTTDKEFKPNPKQAHNGTIEYLSRDAHYGVFTMRGDFEILAYNLIYWLGGKLPWMNVLKNPKIVQNKKEEAFENLDEFLQTCFPNKSYPDGLLQFLQYIKNLKFNEKPNYKKIRDILVSTIEKSGDSAKTLLDFSKSSPLKRRSLRSNSRTPQKKISKITQNKNSGPEQNNSDTDIDSNHDDGDVEMKVVGTKKRTRAVVKQQKQRVRKIDEPEFKNGKLENGESMTPAMKEILAKKAANQLKPKINRRKKAEC